LQTFAYTILRRPISISTLPLKPDRIAPERFSATLRAVIRLVLFDIDGTLIRTGGAGVKAFGKTFETEFKLPHATKNVIFHGRTDVSLVREILRANRLEESAQNFARFFDRYPFWLDHYLHKLDGGPCEGVQEFIDALLKIREKPTLGLLTGNIRLGAELKLRRYNLWDYFETGAFADDHEQRNCIAGIAHKRGNEKFGRELNGEEILVVGDTAHDIECGKSIGAKVLAVGTGGVKLSELAAHAPTYTVADLTKISVKQALA
jgi:phosphoglycolate phosphatase-like HAD superfamily hydrolase